MPWTTGRGGLWCLINEGSDLIPEKAGAGAGPSGAQPPLQELPERGQLIFRGSPAVVVITQFRREESRTARFAGGGDSDVIRRGPFVKKRWSRAVGEDVCLIMGHSSGDGDLNEEQRDGR